MPRRRPILAVVIAAPLLAACGSAASTSGGVAAIAGSGGSSPAAATSPTANTPAARDAALTKAAQCMRSHGVPTFPDPTIDSSGDVQLQGLRGLNRNDPATAAAFTACRSLFRAARPTLTPVQQQARQNALLAYAQCMRKNGFNMPDPSSGTPGQGGGGFFGGANINRNDPTYVKANNVCRPALRRTLTANGGGFGGGFGGGRSSGGAS